MSGTEFEGYEALVSELRSTPPVAPERLRERVLGLAPGSRRRMSRRRRLVLVVVPVAVVLAIGAALVHGFVSSGGRTVQHRADRAALAAGQAALPAITRSIAPHATPQKSALRHLSPLKAHTPAAWNSVY